MRDFPQTLQKWRKFYYKDCKKHPNGEQSRDCFCDKAAEIMAYIEEVIPSEYRQYSIDDFTGKVKGSSNSLSTKVVKEVREKIIRYCWDKNIQSEGSEYNFKEWITHSVLPIRRDNGTNLVIYGQSVEYAAKNGRYEPFKKPTGKTLLAAIIMKEAISLRAITSQSSDQYVWIEHPIMVKRLLDQATNRSDKYNEIIDLWQDCDWLVVDGLQSDAKASDQQRIFKANCLDRVFLERLDNSLPSILVFQEDIESVNLEESFGVGISTIIKNSKTHKIAIK